jgi:hypothetical protein
MKDLQREILSHVAAGRISAEEGAARLEALESNPAPAAAPSAGSGPRQVRIVARFGNTEVIGDPSVSYAVADGPHRARQDGDTMLIEQSPLTDDSFEFSRRLGRTSIDAFGHKLTIRMNPTLPLFAKVQAGNVRIDSIHSPLTAEIQAGNCVVNDFRAPITLAVIAGNVEASGRIDSGASSIRCQMGEVKVVLARSSSVRIKARNRMGEVAIDGDGLSREGNETKLGSGAGTLDIDCTMGSVRVAVV